MTPRLVKFVSPFVIVSIAVGSFAGCAEPPNKATTGALTGSALGAGLGAIVGSQSGHAGGGIAIGAAAGALGGALIGNSLDSNDRRNQQLRDGLNRQDQQIQENQRLIDELKKRGADVRGSNRGVVINIPDILFEFDSDRLTNSARREIAQISAVLQKVPQGRNIAVEGHTDSTGSFDYNQRLSLDRAYSVQKELVVDGVNSRQLEVRGYGEGKPIASNNSEAGRARNRRVEVVIENR